MGEKHGRHAMGQYPYYEGHAEHRQLAHNARRTRAAWESDEFRKRHYLCEISTCFSYLRCTPAVRVYSREIILTALAVLHSRTARVPFLALVRVGTYLFTPEIISSSPV